MGVLTTPNDIQHATLSTCLLRLRGFLESYLR